MGYPTSVVDPRLSSEHPRYIATARAGGAALGERRRTRILGRDDIGSLAAGKAGDMIAVALNRLQFSVVENGRLLRVDVDDLVAEHHMLSRELVP